MGPPPLQLQGHTGAQVPACVLVFGGGVVLPGPLACPSGRGGIAKAGVGGEARGKLGEGLGKGSFRVLAS